MKIAITGGGGFIGAATKTYAESLGHDVILFDRKDGNDILGPLDGLAGTDAVIHLAGVLGTHELFDNVQGAIDINITGSYRIMQWCIENDANYVGILMPDVFPSIYTATKVASQRIAKALHHSRGLKVSHVRAYNVFGPGQAHGHGHPQKLVPTAIINAWVGNPIPVWGSGYQGVDLIYVDEAARILVEATSFTDNQIFDAGTGISMTVNQVVDYIAQAVKREGGPLVDPEYLPMRDGETPTDIVALGENWDLLSRPPMFLWTQMRDTVLWYRDHL